MCIRDRAEALIAYLKAANGEKIKIGIEYLVKDDPIRMDDEGIAIMQKIADEEKYAYMLIDSGAGHDSQLFARYFKSNMIFLPSKDGISHSPEEFTDIRLSLIHIYAERLPFLDDGFDIVISRLAFHHFANPKRCFSEMARVLKPGGKLVVIDMEAAEETLRAVEDEIETLRDPSHMRLSLIHI